LGKAGHKAGHIFGLWGAVVAASAVGALFGHLFLAGASGGVVAEIQAFAAGALPTMLASTMLTEADEERARSWASSRGSAFSPPLFWATWSRRDSLRADGAHNTNDNKEQCVNPTELSRYLREGSDPTLRRRRWVVGLSMVGVTAGQLVSLYQTGVIKHLPDPPGPFDSNRVDASEYAYSRFSSPDGPLMVALYGLTALLAGAGGPERAERAPWLPITLALKTLYDTGTALELAREEWKENRAFCAYCQAATLASAASVALALPEALRAARHLLGRASS